MIKQTRPTLKNIPAAALLCLLVSCGDAPPNSSTPTQPSASPTTPAVPLCSEKLGALDFPERRLVSPDGQHILTASGLYTDRHLLNLVTGKLDTEIPAFSFSENGDSVLILSRQEAGQMPFVEQNIQSGQRKAYKLSVPENIINSVQVLDYNSEAIYFALSHYLNEPDLEVQVIRFDLQSQQQSEVLRFTGQEFLSADSLAYHQDKLYYYLPSKQALIARDFKTNEARTVFQAPASTHLGVRDFTANQVALSYRRDRESERLLIVDLDTGKELWGKDNANRLEGFGPAHFAINGELFYLQQYSNGWDELRQVPVPFYRTRLKNSAGIVFEPTPADIQGGDIGFGDFVLLPHQKVLLTAYQQAFDLDLETKALRPAQACKRGGATNDSNTGKPLLKP